jgi:hypothetical protein
MQSNTVGHVTSQLSFDSLVGLVRCSFAMARARQSPQLHWTILHQPHIYVTHLGKLAFSFCVQVGTA